jgi:hypothetical protein
MVKVGIARGAVISMLAGWGEHCFTGTEAATAGSAVSARTGQVAA